MRLNDQEAERFYRVWFRLLHYVNQRRKLVDAFPAIWQPGIVSSEEALPLRDALWEDDSLREDFIRDNPARLSADDLALVESWQHRVAGGFIIYRYLKNSTVFISDKSNEGYAVLGLMSTIEEMVGPEIPLYLNTVLLPFEDRIIIDGLMAGYGISFGPGIRASLDDLYRSIQERGGLIRRLPAPPHPDLAAVQTSNKKVLSAFKRDLDNSSLSSKKAEEHAANLQDFAEQFLHKQEPPGLLLDITSDMIEAYEASREEKLNLVSFKRFARFLRETFRLPWEEAQELLAFIKSKQ
jgi:hypothetical protein